MPQRLINLFRTHYAAVWKYASSTASMMAGIVGHSLAMIILARFLGPEQFGKLTILTTVISIGMVWIGLGSTEMLRRHVARDRSAYPTALGHLIVMVLSTSAVIGTGFAVGMSLMLEVHPDPATNTLIIVLFIISNTLFFTMVSATEIIFLSHDEVARANVVSSGAGILRAISALIACLGFGVNTLSSWAYWHFGFYLVSVILCMIALVPYGAPKLTVRTEELFKGVSVSLTGLLMMLRQNADILVLSAVAPASVVGIYGVARRLVDTASVVSASMDRLIYSQFAVAGKNGPAATLPLAMKYAGISIVLCGSASLALFILAPFLPWIFGDRYTDAIPTLQILCWILILTSLQWLACDALNASDQHRYRLMAESVAGLTGTVALIGLTFYFGLAGTLTAVYVAGTLVAIALWSTLIWLANRQNESSLLPAADRA